jgi:hypothetical protein
VLGCSKEHYFTFFTNAAVKVNSVNRPREFAVEIFFHRRFSGEPTQIMRRKFVEYLGTDCFHFVEFLSSYLLSARQIQNVGLQSPPQMRKCTDNFIVYSWCAGGLLEAESHVGL